MDPNKKWYERVAADSAARYSHDDETNAVTLVTSEAMLRGKISIHEYIRGVVGDLDEVSRAVSALGYRPCREWYKKGKLNVRSFVSDEGFVNVQKDRISVSSYAEKARFHIDELRGFVDEVAAGDVWMLSAGDEITFERVAQVGSPLVRDNYSAEALADFDHIVGCLDRKDPCGRLALFCGPPGTGKTHMLRGLIRQVSDANFVLVSSDRLGTFAEYKAAKAIANLADNNFDDTNRTVVILLEDADDCLVPRASDNLSKVSAVLNLSDGLIGGAFDLRIVATTNAEVREVDKAITRAGRMCRKAPIGKLSATKATEVLARMCPDVKREFTFDKSATLAEVYQRSWELTER